MAGKYHDLVSFTKKYKGELHSFFLDMNRWRKFRSRYKLSWEKIRFIPANQHLVPQARGIYAFTLELSPTKLPPHGYILYVGITGDVSSSNLNIRYGQYLSNLRNEDVRPAVLYMMSNWRNDLYFNFIPLPNPRISLEKLEKAFINSVIPPVNKRDLDASIIAVKAAVFS